MARWIQLLVTGITMGSIYSLIGLGYVTIYRTSHVVNLAQGGFVMLGSFFAYSFLVEAGIPFWLSIILGVIGAMLISVGMYLLVLRPIIRVSLVNMILATVALGLLFESVAFLKWGGYGLACPPFTGEKMLFVSGVAVQVQSLWIIGMMIVIFVGLHLLNTRTRLGKKMTATATNPNAARMAGISVNKMAIIAFAISAGIGALGGIAISPLVTISYLSGGIFGLSGFVGAILGGWGSSGGAVVGGLTVGIIESVATGFLPAGYQDAVAFGLLILILYFRPRGLLGTTVSEGEV